MKILVVKNFLKMCVAILMCSVLFLSCSNERNHTHQFGEWAVTKAATCSENGVKEQVCVCGKTRVECIPMLPHTNGDWVVSKTPTCIESGLKIIECIYCKKELDFETINKLDHIAVKIDGRESSCTAEGLSEGSQCLKCGLILEEQIVTLKRSHCFFNERCIYCGKIDRIEIDRIDKWDGSVDTSWYDENYDEFLIQTAEQLAGVGALVNRGESFNGKTIYLGANLDLCGREWSPIGSNMYKFSGTFDGREYKISKIRIKRADVPYIGFFGYINGCVKNVYVDSCQMETESKRLKDFYGAGTIAGINYGEVINCFANNINIKTQTDIGGVVGVNYGTVKNCNVMGDIYVSENKSAVACAGLIYKNCGIVDNCTSYVSLKGEDEANLGGLVAQNDKNGKIVNCSASCDIMSTSEKWVDSVGGLVAVNKGNIENSYFEGSVRSRCCVCVGGLVGESDGGKISGCHSQNIEIVGGSNAGGLVGRNGNTEIVNCFVICDDQKISGSCVGGLLGINYYGKVKKSYAIVKIDSSYIAGGLIGFNRGYILDCYATSTLDSNDKSGGLVGRNYGEITRSYSNVNVLQGGLVGGLVQENNGKICQCYAKGVVNSTSTAGGLVDSNYGTISDCYAVVDVNVNGVNIVKYPDFDIWRCISGGLVAYNKGMVVCSYSKGLITCSNIVGDSFSGGLIGYNFFERFWEKSYGDLEVVVSQCVTLNNVISESKIGRIFGNSKDGFGVIEEAYPYRNIMVDNFACKSNIIESRHPEIRYNYKEDIYILAQIDDLKSRAFYSETLKWNEDIWLLVDGEYPVLKWEKQ